MPLDSAVAVQTRPQNICKKKSEICWSMSTRTFSADRWTGNHMVTRQSCAFCNHGAMFSAEHCLALRLLQNALCCRSGPYSSTPRTQVPNTSAAHRVSWGEERLIWADPGMSDVTDPKKYNSIQQWEEKSAGRGARSFATGFPQRLHAHGFSPRAVVCNLWNPECSIILFFLLPGGQAVPFLCQVFLLDLDTCWKAAKHLVILTGCVLLHGVRVGVWNQCVYTGPIVMLMGTVVLSELGQNLSKERLCYKRVECDTCLQASITLWQLK